jgi:hypothetical protein
MPPQLADGGPRFLALSAILVVVVLAWLLGACAFPPKTIRGALKEVRHDDRYEAPCGIRARSAHACDEMPVCCSYRSTVIERNGHKTEFWAFWPSYAPGLLGLMNVGDTATFRLHVTHLLDLQSCGAYGCPDHLEYTLDADTDVVAVVP